MTGDSQVAIVAAVLPANPSRAKMPAAVQFGTVAARPANAPKNEVVLFCGSEVPHSFVDAMITSVA